MTEELDVFTVSTTAVTWSDQHSIFVSAFTSLLSSGILVDVTLSAEGKPLYAHKVILSACSSYFRSLLTSNPSQHPVIILKDVKYDDLKALVDLLYKGAASVPDEDVYIHNLTKTAAQFEIECSVGRSPSGITVFLEPMDSSTECQKQFHQQQQPQEQQEQQLQEQQLQEQQLQEQQHRQVYSMPESSGLTSAEQTLQEPSSIEESPGIHMAQSPMDQEARMAPTPPSFSSQQILADPNIMEARMETLEIQESTSDIALMPYPHSIAEPEPGPHSEVPVQPPVKPAFVSMHDVLPYRPPGQTFPFKLTTPGFPQIQSFRPAAITVPAHLALSPSDGSDVSWPQTETQPFQSDVQMPAVGDIPSGGNNDDSNRSEPERSPFFITSETSLSAISPETLSRAVLSTLQIPGPSTSPAQQPSQKKRRISQDYSPKPTRCFDSTLYQGPPSSTASTDENLSGEHYDTGLPESPFVAPPAPPLALDELNIDLGRDDFEQSQDHSDQQ